MRETALQGLTSVEMGLMHSNVLAGIGWALTSIWERRNCERQVERRALGNVGPRSAGSCSRIAV